MNTPDWMMEKYYPKRQSAVEAAGPSEVAPSESTGPAKVVDAVPTGSSPTDVLLQMDAAVDIILEGFTGDERKRREHALNLIMTLLAVETIALRKTMEELKELKTAEIIAGLKGSNNPGQPRPDERKGETTE